MKFIVNTVQNRGFNWFHHSKVSFKGYVNHRKTDFEGRDAAEFFSAFQDFESVTQAFWMRRTVCFR